jgi:hypothetical protein
MSSERAFSRLPRGIARKPAALLPARQPRAAGNALESTVGSSALAAWNGQRSVQPKLAVHEAGDRFEQEADRVAEHVMRAPEAGSAPGRISSVETGLSRDTAIEEDEPQLQRAEAPVTKKDDEPKLQRAEAPVTKKDDEPKLQRAEALVTKKDDEPKLQRAAADERKLEDLPPQALPGSTVQREPSDEELQAKSAGTPAVTPAVENAIASSKGAGAPLPESERAFFEPRFGQDFGAVRVHSDDRAADAARDLQARAFTHGNDVYFASGHYQPGTDQGRQLMAHELTHPVQQTGGVARKPSLAISRGGEGVQRAKSKVAKQPEHLLSDDEKAKARAQKPSIGTLNDAGDTIEFDEVKVPGFKLSENRKNKYSGKLRRNKAYTETGRAGAKDPREEWVNELGKKDLKALETQLDQVLRPSTKDPAVSASKTYVVKMPSRYQRVDGQAPRYAIGTPKQILTQLLLPTWNRHNDPTMFHVDHVLELQLSNFPDDKSADGITNYELLKDSVNTSSGSRIDADIQARVRKLLTTLRKKAPSKEVVRDFMSHHHLEFQSAAKGENPEGTSGKNYYWEQTEILKAEHLPSGKHGPVQFAKLPGDEHRIVVFPTGEGGVATTFSWHDKPKSIAGNEKNYLAPFEVAEKHFDPESVTGPLGKLRVALPKKAARKWDGASADDREITVERFEGARFTGYIDKVAVKKKLNSLSVPKASPIRIDEIDIEPGIGIVARGKILPNIPLLRGLELDFAVLGDDISIFKQFSSGELKAPSPLRIYDSTLTLTASTQHGLQAAGRVDFGVDKLGSGFISATVSTERAFDLEGYFAFDTKLFDPAEIQLRYVENKWSGSGKIGIPKGRIRGVKSALAEIKFEEGLFSASGSAEFDFPGVKAGAVSVTYSEKDGLIIAGSLEIGGGIPRLKSGSVQAQLEKPPNQEEWEVSAAGTAQLDIPGIDASLVASYKDGIFNIYGTAAFRKGMLSGTIGVGATNQPFDESGQPLPGAKPKPGFQLYGSGLLRLRLAPWLEGSVGVRFTPVGDLQVAGKIGLPAAVPLYHPKPLEKDLVHFPPLDIPILGVSVAGKRVGIFASISGGLRAKASFGVELRNLALEVTYNPAKEEETHIVGTGEIVAQAEAGLELFVRGSIGASLLIVTAEGGIEVSAGLGIRGELGAGVNVDWTPVRGLIIDARAWAAAEPELTFAIKAFASVYADLWLTTIDLWSWEKKLADYRFGSGLHFEVELPLHYEEGKAFDIAVDDVRFKPPKIEPMSLVKGLIDSLT